MPEIDMTFANDPPPDRSYPITYLFVPGDRPDRFDKALGSKAGAIIVDLEDAVAADRKAMARGAFASWFANHPTDRDRVVLRINDESTAWFEHDLALVQASGIGGIVLPKAEGVAQVEHLAAALADDAFVIPLVETAKGIVNVDAVAGAPRVQRIAFGTIDYALDLDLPDDERGYLYPASRIALASRAAGIATPIAGVTADIGDEGKLRADLEFARACGFGAKLCIHPNQVAAIHAAWRPSASEIAWAQAVVSAAKTAQGAILLDGKMIDRPVIARAKRILAQADVET
jgi:citrate lyase subunit beta/citryl-CoA lyase